ncbi:MAG: iron ABC transporter permease [Kiritimatiellaeota bacterium]|nr:iron ABC transporter permease [Kiritimatiellota bacterium]
MMLVIALALLSGGAGFGLPDTTTVTGRAILELRLCRVITGFVVGAALSCAGCALQTVLRNPLAEPYVLGVSGGGAVGAALVIAAGLSALTPLALPGGAFIAAALTLLLVCTLAQRAGGYAPNTLILTGVVVGSMLSSLLMLLISFMRDRALHSITWWLLGNLQATSWPLVATVAGLVALAVLTLCREARALNALALGREAAYHLGVQTRLSLPLILGAATLAAAAAVAVSGIIGFVGLVTPHVLRRAGCTDHRLLLPAAALTGGAFLVLCDMLARTVCIPYEIPVGVVTSLTGGPFFLWLMIRKREVPA